MYRINSPIISPIIDDYSSSNSHTIYTTSFSNTLVQSSSSNIGCVISSSKEFRIPISILTKNSSLEAIVVYMKDVVELPFSTISKLLNRDQRTIWVTYSRAKKKKISESFFLNNSDLSSGELIFDELNYPKSITIPLSIFISRKYSILESIVLFLKNEHALSFNQISNILGKNYRTIWTIYRRAIMKVEEKI